MAIPEPQYYFVELLGTRDGWPENMTEKEEQIMSDHFYYLKDLTARKKVLMAGPVFGKFGMIVLKVYSEEEARAIMADEPSVKQGVHTYTLAPIRASLMAQHTPIDRSVTEPSEKILHKEKIVDRPANEVWNLWTTAKGAKAIFGKETIVELRIGGPFEVLFFDDGEYGMKGSEDCKILSFIPNRMFSFEWNAPPQFGDLRFVKTQVVLFFDETEDGKTRIDFNQYGWGKSAEWDKLYEYFDQAWGYVLENCAEALK